MNIIEIRAILAADAESRNELLTSDEWIVLTLALAELEEDVEQ